MGSCAGGDDWLSYEWIWRHGITDTTCSPYRAGDGSCLHGASACKLCHSNGECLPIANGTRYFVQEHGGFEADASGSNETAMMSEILARGPISCSLFDELEAFKCYNGTGTIDAPPTSADTTHVISVLGCVLLVE